MPHTDAIFLAVTLGLLPIILKIVSVVLVVVPVVLVVVSVVIFLLFPSLRYVSIRSGLFFPSTVGVLQPLSFQPFTTKRSLERVTNGEVQAEAVLKALDVIKARFGGLVGRVQGNAHVKAQHQKVEVVAQTGPRAKRNVLDGRCGDL